MLLDLYITHWTEAWETGEKGFRMLEMQRGLDWKDVRITVVHDGTDPFPEENFGGLRGKIRQVKIPHGGIAAARNWCIDDSKAEWIKWNDYDDMLTNIYALRDLISGLKQAGNCDLVWFDTWFEDARTDPPLMTVKNDRDPVVLHGKVLRSSFLKERGIRFQEYLTFCEDSAFLALVEMEIDTGRIGHIEKCPPIYCYIARNGSLCNRPEIRFKNMQSFFLRHRYVQDEMKKHGKMKAYYAMTVRVMADSYYTLELCDFMNEEGYAEHMETVKAYWMEHREDLAKLEHGAIRDVFWAANSEMAEGRMPEAAFLAWLRTL